MRRVAACVTARVSLPFLCGSSALFSATAAPLRQRRGPHAPPKAADPREPLKDRFPPAAADLSDPRRRLAVLVDGASVEPRVFYNTVFPAACKVGVPVLVRVFAVELSSEWEGVVRGNGEEKKEDDSKNGKEGETRHVDGTPRCPPEFFRVERFIPVTMQMEADASHIFDFRRQNKIEAVCFVCTEVDRSVFEGFLGNIAGNGFNQYLLDELGMAKEVIDDGRSADGTPTTTQ